MTSFFRSCVWMVTCLAAAVSTGAQVSVTQKEIDSLYHWAYSAAFGTGAYRIGDDEVYVIKVEPVLNLNWFANRGVSTKLRLPITFGLQSIDLRDIGDIIDLSTNLKTMTFVPGLEFEIPMRGSWVLKPFGNYGYGHQLSGSGSARIFTFGLNSQVALPALGAMDIKMINALHWFGQVPNRAQSEIFARLVTGFEGNLRLGSMQLGGRQLYLKPHIAHYWYFDPPGFGQILKPAIELKQELEIGVSVGIEERISLKLFSFDRLGIAYKDGGQIQGIRIYLSSVFQ